eukprot:TRINITY_DN2451_c4_g1_i2.p2 TRINITY_DN2451_c4_g1~~TRINITY_DN2451_c4_g1_i2.p2  ORF type:complete len:112 (-),score=3.29 TRINITY_DN2451_c4_g1_i2:374-709(-)
MIDFMSLLSLVQAEADRISELFEGINFFFNEVVEQMMSFYCRYITRCTTLLYMTLQFCVCFSKFLYRECVGVVQWGITYWIAYYGIQLLCVKNNKKINSGANISCCVFLSD